MANTNTRSPAQALAALSSVARNRLVALAAKGGSHYCRYGRPDSYKLFGTLGLVVFFKHHTENEYALTDLGRAVVALAR